MIQIYCDGEDGINQWLRKHQEVKVIDIKMSLNDDGYGIMVVYETND